MVDEIRTAVAEPTDAQEIITRLIARLHHAQPMGVETMWNKLNNPFGISLVLAGITVIAYFYILIFPPAVSPDFAPRPPIATTAAVRPAH